LNPVIIFSSSPVSRFQTLTVLSSEAETNYPSLLRSRHLTKSSWPIKDLTILPVLTFQSLIYLSSPAETILPSGVAHKQ